MARISRCLALAVLSALAWGCGGDGPNGHGWTVLVYMMADNNLEPFAVSNLQQMIGVGASPEMRFVAQVDRSGSVSSAPVEGAGVWSGTRRLMAHAGRFEVVDNPGDVDMADPSNLSDFIAWGIKKYPADHYGLVFWDHGAAWSGFGVDGSHQEHGFTLPQLKQGLSLGLGSGKPFDFIGFDSCLMGTYEVARAMAPFGQYFLGSEQLEPGFGWDYGSFELAKKTPKIDAVTLGKAVLDGFVAQSNAQGKGANITLSLTDLKALDDLARGVDALGAAGQHALATASSAIGQKRATSLKFVDSGSLGSSSGAGPAKSVDTLDLGDFAQKLSTTEGLQSASAQVLAGLKKAVVYNVNGQVMRGSSGLSLYFPPSLGAYDSAYDNLAEVSAWSAFLRTYLNNASSSGPKFDSNNTTQLANGVFQLAGNLVSGASNIAQATLYYGAREGGAIYVLGRGPAAVNGTSVVGSWNLSSLQLQQGALSSFGYLQQEAGANGTSSYVIPFLYQAGSAPAQQVIRRVSWDNAGNAIEDTYYLVTNGSYGELTPAAGSTLTPEIQTVDSTGAVTWHFTTVAFSTSDLANNPIRLSSKPLVTGSTAYGALLVQDPADRQDSVQGTAVVP